MSRTTLVMACAAALLLLAPQAEAQRVKDGPRVRPAQKGTTVRNRHRVRTPQKRVRLVKKTRLTSTARKARLAKSKRTTFRKKMRRPVVQRRRVNIPLKNLRPKTRARVMKLLASKKLRQNRSARSAVIQYLRLRALKGGRDLPISVSDLELMSRSKSWSPKRMANLSKVLRLARYIAKRDKISPKAAFAKALKAAGVYKKYKSGTCKV